MATFADEMAATALEMLREYGEDGVLRRITPGSGPAHNPGPGTPANYPCTLYPDRYRVTERNGTRIEAGDKMVLLATEGIPSEPTVADQLIIRGQAHKVINVDEISAQGQAIMWIVQARR